jgi:Spy/CpxP family protein refolding chaperone
MKTSKWLVIGVVAALSAGGLMVFKGRASERPVAGRSMRGQFLQKAKEKLGLSDDQFSQIKSALLAEKDNLKSLISKLHDARIGLREAIQASDATEASVRAASAKVASAEADLAVERLKLFGKISPILTDEQLDKVKEFQTQVDDYVDGAISHIGERLAPQ